MEQFFLTYGGTLLKGFFATFFLLASILYCQHSLRIRPLLLHHTPSGLSRFGGSALIGGFLLALWWTEALVFPHSWWVFSGVLLLALVVGIWDDIVSLPWGWQLAAQGSMLALLYLGGVRIITLTHPGGGVFDFSSGGAVVFGGILFLAWGILVLNSINWLDGVDGLAGSVLLVTYGVLFILALSPAVYQPPIALLLAAAFGTTLAFLAYNFPPAKIIGGTSGALFFGVVTVFVSVVAGTKIATTLLVLALPVTDTAFVLVKRFVQKRSLFKPDHGHLHHILASRGWSARAIVGTYTLLTLLIGCMALSTQTFGKLAALVAIFSLLGSILTFFHFPRSAIRHLVMALGIGVFLGTLFFSLYQRQDQPETQAFINGQWYAVEVAATPEAREQGLSGRSQLCLKCGMLFVFPEPVTPLFWMKDMRFSLDILWLYDNRVVAKHENLPFPSLETFGPEVPVTKVLELPAGSTRDIPIGTRVYLW